jgi:hypothetical protein
MERSASVRRRVVPAAWRFGAPLAAAAAVAAGFFWSGDREGREDPARLVAAPSAFSTPTSVPPGNLARSAAGKLSIDEVESEILKSLNDSSFQLDMAKADHQALFAYLKKRSLPCPCSKSMPPGLEKVDGVGCRVLEIDGHRGSLVCFDERDGRKVHMLVFFRKEIDGDLPGIDNPDLHEDGEWAVAAWKFKDRVFLLLGETDTEHLAQLF